MTGLSAKTLWQAYTRTGYVFTSDPRRHLRAVLHDALTAKLDADAAERDAQRNYASGSLVEADDLDSTEHVVVCEPVYDEPEEALP